MVLAACLVVTLADSVHFRPALPPAAGAPAGSVAYDARMLSLLDAALARLVDSRETTYSRPLAYESFTKESVDEGGVLQACRAAAALRRRAPERPGRAMGRRTWPGAPLRAPWPAWRWRPCWAAPLVAVVARSLQLPWREAARQIARGQTRTPWRAGLAAVAGAGLAGRRRWR